jgi:hypothetical protein
MRGSGHNSSNFHGGLASLALTVWQVAGVLWRRVEVSSLGIYYLDAGASHLREMINLGRGDYRFQVSCIDCYVSSESIVHYAAGRGHPLKAVSQGGRRVANSGTIIIFML